MNNIVLSPPKFGFIVATRAVLALGIGLLVSRRFAPSRRGKIGRTLVAAGVLSTIPAAMFVARGRRPSRK